jgi:hypothetical protein
MEKSMSLVRITAEYKEGGHSYNNYRIVILCGITADNRIAEGEWFGYVRNESVFHPFVLRLGKEFFYGGEETWIEPTNIGQRDIKVGEYFTLSNSPHDAEKFEAIYAINNIHPVAG